MSNSLMHHGIKGQKYGVRRYQNADGTLTAAGKARYDTGSGGRGVGHLVATGPNSGRTGTKGASGVLSATPNVKSNSSTGQGVLQRLKTYHLGNKYAQASYNRSRYLRRYDRTGIPIGVKSAERKMQIAGRNLTGAQKAAAIARNHRGISRAYNIGAVSSIINGGIVAGSSAVAAMGAPAIAAAVGIGVAGAAANRYVAKRYAKKAKIAQDYANEHKNDKSDYLPEQVRDVENMFYKPKLRKRVAHSGMSTTYIDVNQLKNEQIADAVSIALSSTIS